jgi:hypothetical protein
MFIVDAAISCFAWFTVEKSTLKETTDDQDTGDCRDDGGIAAGRNG